MVTFVLGRRSVAVPVLACCVVWPAARRSSTDLTFCSRCGAASSHLHCCWVVCMLGRAVWVLAPLQRRSLLGGDCAGPLQSVPVHIIHFMHWTPGRWLPPGEAGTLQTWGCAHVFGRHSNLCVQ